MRLMSTNLTKVGKAMNRSVMFSCLLNMDGYGQADSNLTGAIITDALDEFGKSGETDMYAFVVKYHKKVMLAIPDLNLRTHDSDNKYNLSDSTRKWETWAKGLMLAEQGRTVMQRINRGDKIVLQAFPMDGVQVA